MADAQVHEYVELKDFTVTVTRSDPSLPMHNPNDVVIYVDTPSDFEGELRIRLNDALLFKGNPELPEDIAHTIEDGYFVVNKK